MSTLALLPRSLGMFAGAGQELLLAAGGRPSSLLHAWQLWSPLYLNPVAAAAARSHGCSTVAQLPRLWYGCFCLILLCATASGASARFHHWSQRAWKQLRTAGGGSLVWKIVSFTASFPLVSLLQNSQQSFSSPSPTCLSSAAQPSAGLQLQKCSKQPIGI